MTETADVYLTFYAHRARFRSKVPLFHSRFQVFHNVRLTQVAFAMHLASLRATGRLAGKCRCKKHYNDVDLYTCPSPGELALQSSVLPTIQGVSRSLSSIQLRAEKWTPPRNLTNPFEDREKNALRQKWGPI
jgi:hypothetical protein